jgi:hypothetical protein
MGRITNGALSTIGKNRQVFLEERQNMSSIEDAGRQELGELPKVGAPGNEEEFINQQFEMAENENGPGWKAPYDNLDVVIASIELPDATSRGFSSNA